VESNAILAVVSYKLLSLLVGASFAYMGYRLFMAGIWGEAGDVEAQFKDNKIIVKRAAPGTFFALFGAIIICVTLYKGIQLNDAGSSSSTDGFIEIIKEESDGLPEDPPF
jgi:hypothetical protein